MKKLSLYLSFLIILTCAKEDSQASNTPPTQIVKQYTLTASAGDGGSVTGGGTFASGTQVSLTATPSSGYSFSGWSNGSTTNPLTVTLNSNTSITANFQVIINSYTLSVTAGEGGSVSTEGGEYEEGTEVTITATPEEGYEFIGWIGSELTSSSITLTIGSNVTISANFQIDCSYWQTDIPDWSHTSYELFDIYYPENYQDLGSLLNNQWGGESGEYGLNVISVDYNNDGYMDIIGSYNDYSNFVDYPSDYYGYERKQLIRFYKGGCGGNFEVDELNDSKFLGLVHGRKILLGDFNNDDYVDLFLLGHGYDKQPFNGEFNKALMSNGDGSFSDVDYQSFESFYHGGASGDIDNDGDLDIVAVDGGRGKSLIYKNLNGQLEPSEALIDQALMNQMYNAELFDINNDGFIDLIAGGHDWSWGQNPECEWWYCNTYDNAPVIIYGDGVDFINNEFQRLPVSGIDKQGIVTNFEFFDFDNDGQVEIIITRTGDNMNEEPGLSWDQTNFYRDWSIQILKLDGEYFRDATSSFIDVYSGSEGWIRFTKIKDIDNDGILELYNTSNPYIDQNNYLEWEIILSQLIKVN